MYKLNFSLLFILKRLELVLVCYQLLIC